jgi:hypothetical protein
LYFSCKNYQELAQARLTKVVGYFTINPTKLVLHIYDFSVIFYAIYKKQESHFYYLSYPFAGRPSERNFVLQCGPGRPGSGGPAKFRPTAGWGRPGTGGGGSLGPRGPIPGLSCGGERAGEGRRRRPGTVTAAAGIPAAWARCRGVGWLGIYCRCEGRWGAARFGTQPAGACSSSWLLAWRRRTTRRGEWLGAMQGAATPSWRPARLPATDGPTTTLLGVSAGLGRCERQGRRGTDRRSVGVRRPDGARREEGVDSEAASVGAWPGEGRPRDAEGLDAEARYGALERRRRRVGLSLFRTGPVRARFSPKI